MEDVPSVASLEGDEEHEDYLEAHWLSWNDDGQLTYDAENAYGNTSLIIGAETDVHFYIFFKCTYDTESGKYTKEPVFPDAGDNLVIKNCNECDEIAPGEEYGSYFVRLSTTGTIDDTNTTVTADDLRMDVQISKLRSGFFSTTEASTDTYLSEFQMNAEDNPDNVFYWIYRGEGTVMNPDVRMSNFFSRNGIWGYEKEIDAEVTMEKMENFDNVYKVTVGLTYARCARYDSHLEWRTDVEAETSCTNDDGETYTETAYASVRIYAGEGVLNCANIRINERVYHFYEDGAIFCTHATDETFKDENDEIHNIWLTDPVYVADYVDARNDEEIGLPEGVSYDYESNTLTLNGATLDNLYLTHYYESDGEKIYDLSTADVTLKLEGTSTIGESFNVWDHANVTLSGDGNLILKGEVNVYGGTLDMTSNHILLGNGAVVNAGEDAVKGDFWYVEGYTDLRVKWLWNDGNGYYLSEGEAYSTANCWLPAQHDHQVVFYEYKWTKQEDDSYGWTVTPVIPESSDWTITKINASEIATGAKDGSCYVNIRYTAGINSAETTLTANDNTFSMWAGDLNFGFYTAGEADVKNVLASQTQYTLSNDGDNTVYMVVYNPYNNFTVSGVDWYLSDSSLELDDYVTVTEAGNGVYKIVFNANCLDYNDNLALNGKVTHQYGEYEPTEDYVYLQLINPNQKPLAARFFVDSSEGLQYRYDYYTDGTSQVFIRGTNGWNKTTDHFATGFSYNKDSNVLTLNKVNLHYLSLYGGNLSGRTLTVTLTGTNVVDYLDIGNGATVTIQGSGNMELRGGFYLIGGSMLTLNSKTKLYMYRPEEMAFWKSEDSTFDGTLSYETTEFIGVRALSINDEGAYLEDESYTPIEESGIMGMQERVLVFYKISCDGKKWTYTPVKPTVYSDTDNRITITPYTGNVVDDALTADEMAAAVHMKSNDLGGYYDGKSTVKLTIDGKQCDWTLYDLHMAYYSSTTPIPETYLGNGDNRDQHFFNTEVDGDNTFYLIIRAKDTGITVQGDVDWIIDTWGQDYKTLMDLGEDEELVDVQKVTTYDGNLVYEITVSDKYVDYVNYGYNWRNFSIAPIVTWKYSDGNQSTSDYWSIFINPPEETMQPILLGEDFNLYADGKVYGNDGTETTLPNNVTYNAETNTLTLSGVELSAVIELYGDTALNVVVKGQNTLNCLILHDEATVTITGENGSIMTADDTENQGGTLTIVGELCVDGGTTLNIAADTSLVLAGDCVKKVYGTVEGEIDYATDYTEIEIWTLWGDEKLHGPYNLSDGILMGMSDCSALFLRKAWTGEDWDCVVVKPEGTDVLIVNSCDCDPKGYANDEGEDYEDEEIPDYLRAISKDDLVNLYAKTLAANNIDGDVYIDLTLTAGGYKETYKWSIAPTVVGFFSAPEANLDNWMYVDDQYFFSLDPNGDNSFYFIAMAGNCGYTMDEEGDFDWGVDTDGRDLSCFDEELVTVTRMDDDPSGNHIWKVTIGEGYVNYAKYFGAVWNEFSIWFYVHRSYPNDFEDYSWGEINVGAGIKPDDIIVPEANFTINGYAYYYYKGETNILKSGWDENGNPDVQWVKPADLAKHLPKGVTFDKKNNKMTLNNATLENLSFRGYYVWIEDATEDQEETWTWTQIMPKDMVTLELKGKNTIESYDCAGLNLRWGADMTIMGTGSLDIYTTNGIVKEENGDQWFNSSPAVHLDDESQLIIAGSASVKVVNGCAEGTVPGEWLFGIEADGGNSSLTIQNSATLEVRLPEGRDYTYNHDDFPDNEEEEWGAGYALIHTDVNADYGVKTINIKDNATLITDGAELNGATVNMTGGTWNMDSVMANWGNRNHSGLFADQSTLNISGGKLNITQKNRGEEYQDCSFYGLQLTGNSVLNLSGGEINAEGLNDETSLPVTVYTNENGHGYMNITGGTINGNGWMNANYFEMSGGTINLTSDCGAAFYVADAEMSGGTINLTNTAFALNSYGERDEDDNFIITSWGKFKISGGEINITSDYVGLVNKGYLAMNGGKLNIDVGNALGIENWGTFHQMGGEVVVKNDQTRYPAVESHGDFLLNSGTMDLTGRIGIVQANENNNDYWLEESEPMFQTGGGDGDHKLTIHATNIGILANGIVRLTGGSTVNIDVRNTSGPAYGILAQKHTTGGYDPDEGGWIGDTVDTTVTIDGAAKVTINAKSTDGTSVALDAYQSPIIIQSTTLNLDDGDILLTPTVHLKAGTYAILDERADDYSNFAIETSDENDNEVLALYSGSGYPLGWWMQIDETDNYTRTDEDGKIVKEVRISAPDGVTATYATFSSINGDTYRIHEDDGVQFVEILTAVATGETDSETGEEIYKYVWENGTLPKGVTYDLSTNTLTLAKNTTLTELSVNYLTCHPYDHLYYKLPSRNLTLKLNSKATIGRLDLGGDVNAKLTGGTLYLTNGSDATSALTATLTVAKGAGLTINANGSLLVYTTDPEWENVYSEGNLIIEKGATLTNNGTLYMNHTAGGGKINVLGTYKQGNNAYTIVWHEFRDGITGNLLKKYQTVVAEVDSEYDLRALGLDTLAKDYKEIWVSTNQVTLTNGEGFGDFTIPAKVILNPNWVDEEGAANSLTVGAGVTLTIKGTLSYAYGEYDNPEQITKIINNGTIQLEKGGVLDVNGNFEGNAPKNNGGKITPQATKLTVTASQNAIDLYELEEWQNWDEDWGEKPEEPQIVLTVDITTKASEEPLNRVTWTSSNKNVIDPADIQDNLDGTYTILNYKGTGKVTLTATTIDGAKKTAKITLNVTYAGSGKLTAELEGSYSNSFLQVGEDTKMWVKTAMSEDWDVNLTMEESDYAPNVAFYMGDTPCTGNYIITFKSSNTKVATVDGWGNITGIKAGTAKITATMNIPGDKRSVTVSVKVVDPQILRVSLYDDYDAEEKRFGNLYHEDSGNTIFDLAELNENADLRTIKIYAGQLTWNADMDMDDLAGQPNAYIAASKLKWASSDTGIATVKTHKDGYAEVTIKKGAHGVFTITATATDTNKAVGSATFVIKDYTPRFANPSITLNPKQEGGVKLELIESYENGIQNVTFVPDSTKNAGKLEVVYDEENGYFIQAILDDSGKLANQTIKGKLYVKTGKNDPNDDEDVYKLSVTVTVKNAEPKITVTQDTTYGKLDLAYRNNYDCYLLFSTSIGEIQKVELADDSSTDIEFGYYDWDNEESENGWVCKDEYTEEEYQEHIFYLRMAENCGSKINTKVKFNVYVAGYQVPIVVSFTPKTTTSKITVTTNPTATVINGNAESYNVRFGLKVNGDYLDLRTTDPDGDEYESYYQGEVVSVTYNKQKLDFTVKDDQINLSFDKADYPKGVSGTVTVEVKHPSWSQHKTITHKISTSTKAPTVTVETPTMTLYTKFPVNYAYTDVGLNQSNLELVDDIEIVKYSSKEAEKLELDVYADGIKVGFAQDENGNYILPKTGTYTITAKAHYVYDMEAYNDGSENAKDVQFTFKVKVVSTEPSIKLSSNTIKLNTALAGQEEGFVSAKFNWSDLELSGNGDLWIAGYEINGTEVLFPQGHVDEDTYDWVEGEPTYYQDGDHGIQLTALQYYEGAQSYGNFVIVANLTKANATKATYTIRPIVYDYTFDQYYTLSTKLTLTVQPHSSKISVTTKASGKLEILNPDSQVTYAITKVSNVIWGDINNVELLKQDGKNWVPYEKEYDENEEDWWYTDEPMFYTDLTYTLQSEKYYQAVLLYVNTAYEYTAGKTYQFKLRYYFGEGEDAYYVDSGVLSLKMNSSAAKVSASTVNYYHAEGKNATKTVTLNMTSPTGARFNSVELNKSKTSKELIAALTPPDAEEEVIYGCFAEDDVTFIDDWTTANLDVQFYNPAALTAGKSYYLYLDVYPYTLATSVKPVTVKVTVKVNK